MRVGERAAIRPLVEGDLEEADQVFRMAFGTFLGARAHVQMRAAPSAVSAPPCATISLGVETRVGSCRCCACERVRFAGCRLWAPSRAPCL